MVGMNTMQRRCPSATSRKLRGVCGCYAYLVGVNWWQHVNIGRQVALNAKADWFIWCTIPEDDLTAHEIRNESNKRRRTASSNCFTGRTMLAVLRAYSSSTVHWRIRARTELRGIDIRGHKVAEGDCRAYVFVCMPATSATMSKCTYYPRNGQSLQSKTQPKHQPTR